MSSPFPIRKYCGDHKGLRLDNKSLLPIIGHCAPLSMVIHSASDPVVRSSSPGAAAMIGKFSDIPGRRASTEVHQVACFSTLLVSSFWVSLRFWTVAGNVSGALEVETFEWFGAVLSLVAKPSAPAKRSDLTWSYLVGSSMLLATRLGRPCLP